MSAHNGNIVVQVHQNPYARPRVYVGAEEIPVEKLESVRSESRVNADGSLATFVTLEFEVDKLEILTEARSVDAELEAGYAKLARDQIQKYMNIRED